MRLTAALCAALVAGIPHSSLAQPDATTLIAICDQFAASPVDTRRPRGVAGIAVDKVDPKAAIPACEAATKASPTNARMMFQLGRAYGAAKNQTAAREEDERADTAGYALATNNLAALYLSGEGGPADPKKAIRLFEKAANGGIAMAMKNLGDEYKEGKNVPKDLTRARQWYRQAAESSNLDAMIELGLLFYNGHGGAKDHDAAREWFQKAAAGGSDLGMNNYGIMLRNGEGGPRIWPKRADGLKALQLSATRTQRKT